MHTLPVFDADALAASPSPIYIVGKAAQPIGSRENRNSEWEMIGVFSTKENADAVASGHDDYFVGPWVMDHAAPYETVSWPGCYHPDYPDAVAMMPAEMNAWLASQDGAL
jgi:hypothetical protein